MPYDWWVSAHDSVTHAFPIFRDASAEFHQAACAHAVPPELLVRERGADYCLSCLTIAGSHLRETP
ncbi:hypothetical protein [Goodfellowiella coeruleoviolacea]|uniref:Uncharacterized protein n=1 Tax=Goodfellowiella coeruleoviolacea TaxID=334858 RepID=A0AAE3GE21_9PSEU|nr:hypothetical protein [Goodfellowiella coeruleoviolacea]MCP2165599.1 hypothetical protein [Goodfellowiella coeruleoviolacea]